MRRLYKSTGFWRFEFAAQGMEWGLPFQFTDGAGAFTFGFLCFQFIIWRNDFRYDPRL